MLSRKTAIVSGLIALLYLSVNFYFYQQEGVRVIGDSQRYLDAASAIQNGEEIQGKAWAYPGYNGFVWLCREILGLTLSSIVLLQVLWGAAAIWILALLAKQARYSSSVIALGLLALVLFPDLMIWNSYILTDAMYTWCLIIAMFLLAKISYRSEEKGRMIWMVLALVLSIFTSLIRPTGWVFLPIALAWLACVAPRHFWQKCLGFSLACVIVGLLLLWKRGGDDLVVQESLNDHVSRGTILWDYPPWYLTMPQDDLLSDYSMSGMIHYALRYPVDMLRLAGARALSFFVPLRPYFSLAHNIFLAVYLLPLYILIGWGLPRAWRSLEGRLVIMTILAHVALTMATFNVQDNRWFIHVFPLFVYLSMAGLESLRECVRGLMIKKSTV